ncbi:MAG: hypothetical protein DYH08_03335 [Actinobacteria bacterium ATB1]|nr:hypothetical protein [Actinobacteria bacterium ATB1]
MRMDDACEPELIQPQARALGHPTRHAIFRRIAGAQEGIGIAELTAAFGLNHNAIRQHVAKLVDAGLVSRARVRSGRKGRPRSVYTVDPSVESRWGVTGPYERLSHLLAEVIRSGDDPVEVGHRAGRKYRPRSDCHSSDCVVEGITEAMAREGFDPEVRPRMGGIDIVLRRCAFESTAEADPDTVCSLHLGIARGVAEGYEDVVAIEKLVDRNPQRGGCKLRVGTHADTDKSG